MLTSPRALRDVRPTCFCGGQQRWSERADGRGSVRVLRCTSCPYVEQVIRTSMRPDPSPTADPDTLSPAEAP